LITHVHRIVTGPFQENSFVVRQDDSTSCLIIDPGDDSEKFVQYFDEHGLTPLAIINTHAHLDHIGAVFDLKSIYSIPFFLHSKEKPILDGYESDCALFGLQPKGIPSVDTWFDGTSVEIEAFEIQMIETPGHTPGGTCLVIGNHVFTGDTIFAGSIGRTDLPGGDWDTLNNSLVKAMNDIPHDYILHPGHGPDTTLVNEMKQNPFLIPLLNRVNS